MLISLDSRIILLLCLAGGGAFAQRPTINLDGEWRFATDPQEVGEADGWQQSPANWLSMPQAGYREDAAGTVRVPGSWDAQGYGEPNEARFHQHLGLGWYRRTVRIPADWEGKSIFLTIGGVHRQARIWVNGQYCADHVGYLAPIDLDVSAYAKPGEDCTITIRVDARQDIRVDVPHGTTDGVEMKGGGWGGIWGHVRLEARREAYLTEPLVETLAIEQPRIRVAAKLAGALPHRADQVIVAVRDADHAEVARVKTDISLADIRAEQFAIELPLPGAKLWSPDTPNLYTAKIELLSEGELIDELEQRFGVRELEIDGQYFVLNGSRIFLAAAGDDNVYPDEFGALYVDREKLLRRTRLMKTYGFNAIRTHTSVMSPDFYDVCDELGMLVRAEFPLGGRAINQARASSAAQANLDRELRETLVRHRNHPSIYSWSMGNEIRPATQPIMLEVARRIKRTVNLYDPDAYFIDGANTGTFRRDPGLIVYFNVMEWLDRDTLDYSSPVNYSEGHPYAFGGVAFDHAAYQNTKPAIIHESGEFVTFPNLANRHDFNGSIKPHWLERMAERYEDMGLLVENALWTEVSEKLFFASHKLEMENIRLQDAHAGYDLWLFQDFWGTSNGVMTHYLQPKPGVPAEGFSVFNNPHTVLLKRDLKLTYREGDLLDLSFLVWHYGLPSKAGATLDYVVKLQGKVLAEKSVSVEAIAQGAVTLLGSTSLTLPAVAKPSDLRIFARLVWAGGIFENAWSAKVFPRQTAAVSHSDPVFTATEHVGNFERYDAQPIPPDGMLDPTALYLVNNLNERLITALEDGASVVLLHPEEDIFPSYKIMRWRSGFWNGNQPYRSVGHVIYEDHPLGADLTGENWFSHEWWYLFEDSRSYYLDQIPTPVDVIVRNIDGPPRVSDKTLLFAVKVGRGRLVVSGLNHLHAGERPEVQWLTDRIVSYLATEPVIHHELSPEWLRQRREELAAAVTMESETVE